MEPGISGGSNFIPLGSDERGDGTEYLNLNLSYKEDYVTGLFGQEDNDGCIEEQKTVVAKGRKRAGLAQSPILHSDVEKLRRERLNYFIDELRQLVPVSSTGKCESHRTRRPKYAVLADTTHYIRELQAKLSRQENNEPARVNEGETQQIGIQYDPTTNAQGLPIEQSPELLTQDPLPSNSQVKTLIQSMPPAPVSNTQRLRSSHETSAIQSQAHALAMAAHNRSFSNISETPVSVDVVGNMLDRTMKVFVSHKLPAHSEGDEKVFQSLIRIINGCKSHGIATLSGIQCRVTNCNVPEHPEYDKLRRDEVKLNQYGDANNLSGISSDCEKERYSASETNYDLTFVLSDANTNSINAFKV